MKYRSLVRYGSFLLALPFALVLAFSTPPQEISTNRIDPCYGENWTFNVGEELTYKIYYNWNFVWLPAGEVVFKVSDEDNFYHLSARGRTYSSYEWFFKVRDSYDTYIDKQTLLPMNSIREVNEGGYKLVEKLVFDQSRNSVACYRGKDRKTLIKKDYKINSCMHDILSIVYHTRNIRFTDLKKGEKLGVKIFMDEEVFPLNVAYKGRYKNLHIKDSGRYNAFKFSPEVISGEIFKEGSEMNVWVSDDSNQVPVYIESPVSVGSVKVILQSYRGLRYPFTAKTK